MQARQLSHELREETNPDLKRRRWIIGLSTVGVLAGVAVTLYQTGIIKHLPDPPLSVFDSDRVDASDYAYSRFNSPDAPMMITSYGITTLLASMGGKNRAADMPLASLALFAKILADVAINFELTREEWKEQRAFCSYCQTATLVSLASAALAAPEAVKAAQKLMGNSQSETKSIRSLEAQGNWQTDANYQPPLEQAVRA